MKAALAGGEYAALPVLSQASCFSRTAGIPAGEVTIRDAAGLYPFENTLEARLLTGAQLKEYLEYLGAVLRADGCRVGRWIRRS